MIRVGLIGAGFVGRNHFNQYEKLPGRASVVALCDREADRRAGDWSKVGGNLADTQGTKRDLGAIKPYTNWQDLLADPDVDLVDICVPTTAHCEISIAALKAGKHVLCEKPMALSVADCDLMLAAGRDAPGKFMIAQCIRFWPEYVFLKSVFDQKKYGLLKALSLRRQAEAPTYSLNSWVLKPELSGGAVLDLHVHDVDFAIHLLGKPQAVTAQGYPSPQGSLDHIHAFWHYGPGLVVSLEGCWDLPAGFGFNMGFTAVFEQAAITWDLATGKPLTVFRSGSAPETPAMLAGGDGYFGEIAYFIECIERGQTPKTSTPQESRDAVALALAEKKSALSNKRVNV
ncbi:MAG: Gfo/Idh/MocA family oxidoreductase [Phycisphaerae bacterium]|nr:Gfo/Idh/MocA family oxidoreductase [Phycisphaerae bacterium]